MTVNEVRKRYLDFFAARGHAIIPSAPIVPENDPTTLFTSSGMQSLVPYLLGHQHPQGKRLADSQLSFRAEDIEEVGDNRHTTFFEMLGNWSLGDYFKQEQLPWLYEFLTRELGLAKEKLWVTCFEGDEKFGLTRDQESADIWKRLGIPDNHIHFYGSQKNWWSRSGTPDKMPAGEPGGSASEMFYDFGTSHDEKFGEKCHPNCDCGRFLEIGNNVFMEYVKNANGSFDKLPQQNVDFGGGLERLTAATLGNPDIFLIDIFDAARAEIEKRALWKYDHNEEVKPDYRVVLDHTRAAIFMLASGIVPGPNEQGSVLRRLIRGAILATDRLGIKEMVLAEVAKGYGNSYADQYSFLLEKQSFIRDELTKEETLFRKTVKNGLRKLDKIISANGILTGDDIFNLYTTDGFPPELTMNEVVSRGIKVASDSSEVYKARFRAHREESSVGAAQKFAGGLADSSEQTVKYHTAHHLLLKALQKVLGPDVHQRGSNITSERLRIDFSYVAKMTPEQIAEVEKVVNEQIKKAIPVEHKILPKEEAEKLGAEHEFGAKYPDMVSIYIIGDSIEFCGGPHVENTSELGHFKILKEEASSAGVRRIKAVLE